MEKEKSEQLKWDIICTGNEVIVSDTNIKIQELYGGFGQGQKMLTVQQIALLHVDNPNDKDEVKKKVSRINELINENINNFIYEVDIYDIKGDIYNINKLLEFKICSQNSINRANNVYILSAIGYCKLYNVMRNKDNRLKEKILELYFECGFVYNDNIICKEISFKNDYERKINIILKNALISAWNINKEILENIIDNKQHIPQHQYSVCNGKYQIDFFFKELKIIVEFDELWHKNYITEDVQRMNEIIQFLSLQDGDCGLDEQGILRDCNDEIIDSSNCDYIIVRINENDELGIEKVIGLIVGKIFSLV